MIASTFATKNFPETVEDITLGNNWVPLYVSIPVLPSFEECLR